MRDGVSKVQTCAVRRPHMRRSSIMSALQDAKRPIRSRTQVRAFSAMTEGPPDSCALEIRCTHKLLHAAHVGGDFD